MKRASNFQNKCYRAFLALCLAIALPFALRANVGITVVTQQNGNEVTADFLVYDFTDIISMQFSVNWNPSLMQFEEVSQFGLPGMAGNNFGLANSQDGALLTSWFDLPLQGVSLPNCSSIFQVKFTLLGPEVPLIAITSSPIDIEFTQMVNGNTVIIPAEQTSACENAGQIQGNLFNDLDDDCALSSGETGLEDWKVQISGNGLTYYRTADHNGQFGLFVGAGDYEVTLILPENGLWGACATTLNLTVAEDENVQADFPAQAIIDCPAMTVDLSAPFLLRCFENHYQVHYCNEGTIGAEDASVEIEFDPFLQVLSSSIPWSGVSGNVYTFDLGDVAVGQCGDFSVEVLVSCEAVLGQAHCSAAHVFPDETCQPTSALWDGSSLGIEGICDGDQVVFTITNHGADMGQVSEFIVIGDDMVQLPPVDVLLQSLETQTLEYPATGITYRGEVQQSAHHPGQSMPSATVEGCLDGAGSVSLGFATMYPQDENDPWIDMDCQENIGSYDPNDKTGYPKGYGEEHFILPGTDIEYRIRFQNTGTAAAVNIAVLDTLSPFLDPATVRPGASSHPYDFELLGEGVVRFNFPSIWLPDSTSNLAGSNGFVKFTVSPRTDVPLGSVVENTAAIYFDFNQPVITNQYFHTIAEDFILQEPNAAGFSPFTDLRASISPNPVPDGKRPFLMVQSQAPKDLLYQVFDTKGKLFAAGKGHALPGSTLLTLEADLQPGIYLLKVTDGAGNGTALKLVVQ